MKIIEFNHKTAENLLEKSVKKWWAEDTDAWVQFTDGSVVCIHATNPMPYTYVSLIGKTETNKKPSFRDEQSSQLYNDKDGEKYVFMNRSVSMDFDHVRYYYYDQEQPVTRTYIPVIEFHYYEKGEEWQ